MAHRNRLQTSFVLFPLLAAATLFGGARGCLGEEGEEPTPICECAEVWAPVCGVDGLTYGSGCDAACAGVGIAHDGACAPAACRSSADCGPGEHCENLCVDCPPNADCAALCEARCVPDACVCPEVYAPVCGADGTTYGNSCEASCVGVPVAHDGECAAACPAFACFVACEFGSRRDEHGCETCECLPPPPASYCTSDDACAPGSACDLSACESPCGDEPGIACAAVCIGVCRPVACPPVLCDLACEGGLAHDPTTGCEICACDPTEPPVPAPAPEPAPR